MNDTEKILYKLPSFEGPLDLLLTLISKNKVDIYDIPIHGILEQYLEQIGTMREHQMDISSEFLEMAARLVHIKSVMLLPKHEEEAEELKQELTGQLIEYRECKRVAAMLTEIISHDRFCREPAKIDIDMTYTRSHDVVEMLKAYLMAAGRGKRKLPPPAEAFSGIVTRKIVSVNSKIVYVLKRLWNGQSVKYSSLFESQHDKSELVATFLALLELVKGKRIRINGDGTSADVVLVGGGHNRNK